MGGLAPRPGRATNPTTGQTRDSGLGAAGKKEQRSRNKGSDTAHLTKNSGSSGKALAVAQLPKIEFDDVADIVVHLCDIAAKLSHTQLGSSGWLSGTLNIPLEYSPEVVAAHLASQQGMVFMKVYYVPMSDYLEAAGVLGGDGDASGD
jgi:hypothetical protein